MKFRFSLFVAIIAISVIGLLDWTLRVDRSAFEPGARDLFMEQQVIELQEYISTEFARGFVDLRPLCPGHCLVLPKRHAVRFEELTSEELVQIGYIIRLTHEAVQMIYGPCDYLLLQKNGPNAGQTVPHVHWHYLPRNQSQRSVLRTTLNFLNPFHARLTHDQMKEQVDAMKRELQKIAQEQYFTSVDGNSSSAIGDFNPADGDPVDEPLSVAL